MAHFIHNKFYMEHIELKSDRKSFILIIYYFLFAFLKVREIF